MTTAVTIQRTNSFPDVPSPSISGAPRLKRTHSQKENEDLFIKSSKRKTSVDFVSPNRRKERPCDGCRRRKSRCVVNDDASVCVLCIFYKQDCTYVEDPQPRRRRNNSDPKGQETKVASEEIHSRRRKSIKETTRKLESQTNSADIPPESDLLILNQPYYPTQHIKMENQGHYSHVGFTTELEPALLDLLPLEGDGSTWLSEGLLQKVSDHDTFLKLQQDGPNTMYDLRSYHPSIDEIIGPYGTQLVYVYFEIVHPNFPILNQASFLKSYRENKQELSPALLGAMYVLASNWWYYDQKLCQLPKPDIDQLETIAYRALEDELEAPKISTIQAGVLLRQNMKKDKPWRYAAPLLAASEEVGLHLDSSNWNITSEDHGLRKRLAWTVFMQDKWDALTNGRCSHITNANWAVQSLTEDDFEDFPSEQREGSPGSTGEHTGKELFRQIIVLSMILSEVLDTFYTLKSIREVEEAGSRGTLLILEKAKPVQIKLKEWFSHLPSNLRMDSPVPENTLCSTGYLHLAYFATEISLHRCIIRSLSSLPQPASFPVPDTHIMSICRSAAKTRLISAMDFANRLKPCHLKSFWIRPSKTNFALIGTFGCLLLATSPTSEEKWFYERRITEFMWTVKVSERGGASWMSHAARTLENGLDLLKGLEQRRGVPTGGHTVDGVRLKQEEGIDMEM